METTISSSKATLLISRVVWVICVLFLLMDSIMKVVKATPSMEGCVQLGWPEEYVQILGISLLAFTIIYLIPRTAVLGALLITAYLGGAAAIMIRANISGHPFYFPIFVAVLVWLPIFLKNEKFRNVLWSNKTI